MMYTHLNLTGLKGGRRKLFHFGTTDVIYCSYMKQINMNYLTNPRDSVKSIST